MRACPRIEYVIFDMDGLLIDTESVYTQVTNDILAPHGVQMTWEIKAGLMGKVEQEASVQLLSYFPGIALTPEEYIAQRTIGQDRLWPAVRPLPGVPKLIAHLAKHKIPIVVATSSKRRNFLLKSAHLHQEIFAYFGCGVEGTEEMVVCGDDVSGKTSGKPEPYIFLYAAQEKLRRNVGDVEENVSPEHALERSRGLVFEDAIPGVEAGKRAGMSVVWVPDPNLLAMEYSGKHIPDETLRSIEEFRPEEWGLPPYDSIVRGVTGVK
ncbi:HAD-like protein [Boletus edulis BED1]|uniref:HAD-like protein n=1 Tax=Boletus edulis BED1 TaxID=1328754 RepID=A0AAD4GHA0_BOLED|nr:HAD-like protein [Boletus edulis BED1]